MHAGTVHAHSYIEHVSVEIKKHQIGHDAAHGVL